VEFTKSPERHRNVLDAFWEIFDSIPPDRQQICLCDCAPVLSRLGEDGRGADAALSLLRSRDRYRALYARRHAIEALVTFLAGRQLDDEIALKLLGDGVERREEMAEHIIYYIEGLLTLAPEAGADYLFKRIPKPDPKRKNKMYDLLIHSCVARALAAAGDHDRAYKSLADIIAASGQLDRHQRASVLRHVITSLRLCGGPKSSIKLLRSLQGTLQQEGNLVFTAPILFEAIETIGLLAESADEMRRIQGVIRMLNNIDLDPGQFWEVQKALISCVRSIRNWGGKEGDIEAAYQLLGRIRSSVNKFFAGQPRREKPAIFYHGSALIGIADALVRLGRDSEAATVFSEAFRIIPHASPQDRDDLSANLVEAVSQMETRYQVHVLLKLLETFPKLVQKGLGSPRLKDSVLPKIVDIALMGEPLFKAKLREREGLVIQNIRKRLRTDSI
jgi:tetratricopeptide (TPR) repeat protein